MESLGCTASPELCERLRTLSIEQLKSNYDRLIDDLKEMVGAHRRFSPMYPNFPAQVMEMSQFQLYWNAFRHYCTNRLPGYSVEKRQPFAERTTMKTIELGTLDDFEKSMGELLRSNTSTSDADKAAIRWFVKQYRDRIAPFLPQKIEYKENIAFLGGLLLSHTSLGARWLDGKITTATDVLRLAVAMSDGDVSLATATKFRSFNRSERKSLLRCLEGARNRIEDMLRYAEAWKRLGERLHPGDYAERFPETFNAFKIVRNNLAYQSFASRMEETLHRNRPLEAVESLKSRPGDFARRLDHLLRICSPVEIGSVLESFRSVIAKVAVNVLLQVEAFYLNRNVSEGLRVFFIKGLIGKLYATPDRVASVRSEVAAEVVQICREELLTRFRMREPLGKCFIDPNLDRFVVPFSIRSAAKSLRTLVRGSRLKISVAGTVRFFLWWKNGSSRTDIDLSAAIYGHNYDYLDVLSYYNLKGYGGHHSGNIVDAPNGAAEFIDLDVERCAPSAHVMSFWYSPVSRCSRIVICLNALLDGCRANHQIQAKFSNLELSSIKSTWPRTLASASR
ncbi:MAG: hypothetical protein QM811_28290 [Pirellulales bacterium]